VVFGGNVSNDNGAALGEATPIPSAVAGTRNQRYFAPVRARIPRLKEPQ
jgi:hypothetical protein